MFAHLKHVAEVPQVEDVVELDGRWQKGGHDPIVKLENGTHHVVAQLLNLQKP